MSEESKKKPRIYYDHELVNSTSSIGATVITRSNPYPDSAFAEAWYKHLILYEKCFFLDIFVVVIAVYFISFFHILKVK